MEEMDVHYRPKVHKLLENKHFAYMPDIPIPRLDPYVLRPPYSIDLESIDDKNPEFKKMEEEVTAAFEEFRNLTPQQYEHINDWLAITSYFGVPGFKPYLQLLDRMFLTPTKTEIKLTKQRVMDLTSQELPEATSTPRFKPDDILKALEFGRKLHSVQKFRSEFKEDETVAEEGEEAVEEAVEEDRYEVYKPEKEHQIKRFDLEDININLEPEIFDRDRYKGKLLVLDEDDERKRIKTLTTTSSHNIFSKEKRDQDEEKVLPKEENMLEKWLHSD